MPLSKIQSEVLRLLAAHRDPESYVGGSTPLNRSAARYSADIDVFHDREERVATAAQQDAQLLQQHGYALRWLRRDPVIYTALVERAGETTKLEWVVDSDFRFLSDGAGPGFRIHPAPDRSGHKQGLSRIWTTRSFTPEGIIQEIRRTARYTAADFRQIASDRPIDPAGTMQCFFKALNAAEAFVARMPTEKVGLLFLKGGRVVQPDPERLDD